MVGHDSRGLILVADDTAESLAFMNEALAGAGYTVLVAMDGQQALNIARRMPPDLIMLDAMMPNMDGFEACREMKSDAELEDIPVIFMTGLSDPDDVVKGLELGGVDYLTKPVNLEVMLARVQVHLSNSRKTKSARMALEEMGQSAFACDANGRILWQTRGATSLVDTAEVSIPELESALREYAAPWLMTQPQRNDLFKMQAGTIEMQLRFLGRPAPGEFLLRLISDDEELHRRILRQTFELTEREAEVLLWLSRGKTNQEIGQILSMSPRTVNKHLEPVFRKLNVENRTSAAAAALASLTQQ